MCFKMENDFIWFFYCSVYNVNFVIENIMKIFCDLYFKVIIVNIYNDLFGFSCLVSVVIVVYINGVLKVYNNRWWFFNLNLICLLIKISIKVFIVMMFIIRFWVEMKIVNIKL